MSPCLVSTICSELRRLAAERRADWALVKQGHFDDPLTASAREEWRFWREQSLLGQLAKLPLQGHRVMLQSLLFDVCDGYKRFLPECVREPVAVGGGVVGRLFTLDDSVHWEFRRFLGAPNAQGHALTAVEAARSAAAAALLRPALDATPIVARRRSQLRCLEAMLQCKTWTGSAEAASMQSAAPALPLEARWTQRYAAQEEHFRRVMPARAAALGLRRRKHAKTIQAAWRCYWHRRLRKSAARGFLCRRSAKIIQAAWRSHRRLLAPEDVHAQATDGPRGVDAAVAAVLRIQALYRGSRCRRGWARSWSPRTAQRQAATADARYLGSISRCCSASPAAETMPPLEAMPAMVAVGDIVRSW